MNYQLALFDFDGTLADSFPFFISVQNQLAARHGFREIAPDQIEACRHLTPQQLMRRAGLSRWKLPFLASSFVELMRDAGGSIALFDGVADVLMDLHARGVVLALVTSNSEANARRILGERLAGLFAHIDAGASMFGKRPRIVRVLKASQVPAARAIYVGDQTSDGEAARKAGVAFGAVSWGYATGEALQQCAPQEVFESVGDLRRIGAGIAAGQSIAAHAGGQSMR